eukprot:1478280-Lingulodinium_polyedra.AAC.1
MLEGAGEEVLAACRSLRCDICERLAPPRSDPQASTKGPETFNQQTLHDTFYIWDAQQNKWAVPHLLDGFCAYHVGDLVQNVSSQAAADCFHDRWLVPFGAPRTARHLPQWVVLC